MIFDIFHISNDENQLHFRFGEHENNGFAPETTG